MPSGVVQLLERCVRDLGCRFARLPQLPLAAGYPLLSSAYKYANLKLAILLVVSLVCVMALFLAYTIRDAQMMVRLEAERTSQHWAKQFVGSIPDVARIANGQPPSVDDIKTIETFSKLGTMFRFELFDQLGRSRLVSDKVQMTSNTEFYAAQPDPVAATVIKAREPAVALIDGSERDSRPNWYSETYVPIIANNQVVGALAIDIDQTIMYDEHMVHAQTSAIVLCLLSALIFSIPAVAFYIRSEEAARTSRELAYLSGHDALTGVANRAEFQDVMQNAVSKLQAGNKLALFYIDLDHFKCVNDTLGHDVGDKLLSYVAQHLLRSTRRSDLVARIGGDEFAILLSDITDRDFCEVLAKRILEAFKGSITIDGHSISTGLSIGVAVAPADTGNIDQLIKSANVALHAAKTNGRGTFRIYEEGMDAEMRERQSMQQDLRAALDGDQFVLHYQPLVAAYTGTVSGYEALIRWIHPVKGLIPPLDFIPIAEESGFINDIGQWAINKACSDAASWPTNTSVAVNLSAKQLLDDTIVRDIAKALDNSGLPPNRLEIEITESVLLHDFSTTLSVLSKIKETGVRISMDDFGTGYSSLSYLQSIPFDTVKIDRSFVDDIETSQRSRAIVKAVIDLSKSLGKSITAEGVETVAQANLLAAEGCTKLQGYLISKPMPATDLASFHAGHQHRIAAQKWGPKSETDDHRFAARMKFLERL